MMIRAKKIMTTRLLRVMLDDDDMDDKDADDGDDDESIKMTTRRRPCQPSSIRLSPLR